MPCAYHAPAVLCRENSRMPCCAPVVLRQCRVLRESPRIAGKFRTANRKTPRGSQMKPKLDRSPTGRREKGDVSSYRGLEMSLAKQHGVCDSNTVAQCYSDGKDTI